MHMPQAGRASLLGGLLILEALLAGCTASRGGGAAPAPLAPVATAADAATRPEQMRYAAPTAEPGRAVERFIRQPQGAVFKQALASLGASGLMVELADPKAGLLVARYAGAPATYVDCGTITTETAGGGQREVEAAGEVMSFRLQRGKEQFVVQRDLVLNARMVMQIRAEGGGTRVRSRTTYVLSKRTRLLGPPAQVPPPQIESITFESGGRADFAKTTTCQATGTLERLPFVEAGA